MKVAKNKFLVGILACVMSIGCEKVDLGNPDAVSVEQELVSMEEVAQLLSCVQLGTDRMQEVHDAVSASQGNGYDEEYMLADLLSMPGRGVGEEKLKSSLGSNSQAGNSLGCDSQAGNSLGCDSQAGNSLKPRKTYSRPLKALFEDYCAQKASLGTKAGAAAALNGSGTTLLSGNAAKSASNGSGTTLLSGNAAKSASNGSGTTGTGGMTAEDYLRYLENSGMQIYWPESQSWDGTTAPVVTFAPEDESAKSNVGWYMGPDGNVDSLTVDEAMAQSRPVWVINRNDDSPFVSLEVMRKNNPDWGSGGNIQIIPSAARESKLCSAREVQPCSARESKQSTMLLLKSFKMLRQYDNWFRGGSEFMIRIGAINSFTASTEAELKLYNPEVTEFMVSVKRKELNVEKPLGVIMVSDWTEQLEDCAFMVTEDDGGTRTSWKCSGTVKINSKSYGFEVTIPLNSYDDIVWRGKLSRKYLRSSPTITGRFGDTEITFATETY